MTGTRIFHSGTIGIDVTLDAQNPVFVADTATITTTGAYALEDSAPSTNLITNYGVLTATSGIGVEFTGHGALTNAGTISGGAEGVYLGNTGRVKNLGSIAGTGTAGIGVLLQNGGTVVNGAPTITGLSITGVADGVLVANGGGTVRNFGKITATGAAGAAC